MSSANRIYECPVRDSSLGENACGQRTTARQLRAEGNSYSNKQLLEAAAEDHTESEQETWDTLGPIVLIKHHLKDQLLQEGAPDEVVLCIHLYGIHDSSQDLFSLFTNDRK